MTSSTTRGSSSGASSVALIVALALAGCAECRTPENRACTCAGGRRGVQLCTSESTFGSCVCTQAPAPDAGDVRDAGEPVDVTRESDIGQGDAGVDAE